MKQKFDPISSLLRQTLSSATRPVVEDRLHLLSCVDAGLPRSKTDPAKATQAAGATRAKPAIAGKPSSTSPAAVDLGLRRLTPVDTGLRKSEVEKAKPNGGARDPAAAASPLSPRQLAAARMLARGRMPGEVAAELRMSGQGLWKWRRTPAFIGELRRLHEWLSVIESQSGRK